MSKPVGRKRGHSEWVVDGLGNRTALTPARAERLLAHSRRGYWPQTVALLERVTPETLLGWIERGTEEHAVEPYKDFADQFLASEAEHCAELQDALTCAALGVPPPKGRLRPDAQTCMWLLERRFAFLWKGAGVAAQTAVLNAQERRGLRLKAEEYLRALPEAERSRARELGFIIQEVQQ